MQGIFKTILLTLLSWVEKLEHWQNDQTNVSFGQTNVTYVSAKKPRLQVHWDHLPHAADDPSVL